MPAALLTRDEVVARLTAAFREHGYDGASLATLGEATGLGKSSLYHHFPDGKAAMAAAVLAALTAELARELLAPLADRTRDPARRLDAMLAALDAFYAGGTRACLLERLAASAERAQFRRPLAAAFTAWLDALTALARDARLSQPRAFAEDTVARVEGALVLAAATDDPGVFGRTLRNIRKTFAAR